MNKIYLILLLCPFLSACKGCIGAGNAEMVWTPLYSEATAQVQAPVPPTLPPSATGNPKLISARTGSSGFVSATGIHGFVEVRPVGVQNRGAGGIHMPAEPPSR